ncbi:MAG: tetratricopeptide repeat protein [Chthonomonadaceae bacterium]|nr:tetratricopeptide repeat protein [Chthonomonadaceae bacterium]
MQTGVEDFATGTSGEQQVSVLLEEAYRLRAHGDPDAARNLCERALQIKPESTSAYSLLGQIYAEQGDREKAIRAYERVLELNPGSIADRVKLDELRAGSETASEGAPRPRITMTGHHTTAVPSPAGLAAIGAGVLLFLFGAVLILQDRSGTKLPAGNTAPAENNNVSPAAAPPVQALNTSAEVHTPSPVSPTREISPASLPISSGNTAPAAPSPARTGTSAIGSRLPSTYPVSIVPAPVRVAAQSPGQTTRPTDPEPSRPDRVHLPPATEDGVTYDGNGQYTIRIDTSNVKSGSGTPAARTPAEPSASSSSNAVIKVRLAPDSSTAREASDPPRIEAQSLISLGTDLMTKGDYNGAIRAFQKALPHAGDEAGYLHQKIAQCFQHRGARESAISHYEKAIVELQKQIDAGRRVELARDAIRVCEAGIRICRSE